MHDDGVPKPRAEQLQPYATMVAEGRSVYADYFFKSKAVCLPDDFL